MEQGSISPAQLARRETALLHYVTKQAENSTPQSADDPATQSLNIAYAQEMHQNPEFLNLFETSLENRLDITPGNLGRRGFKALVTLALNDLELDVVHAREPQDWRPLFEHLEQDPGAHEKFIMCLNLPIASNVSERSKLLKGVALLNDFSHPLKIVDFGSSLNLNLKRLVMQDYLAGSGLRRSRTAPPEWREMSKEFQYDTTRAMRRTEMPDGSLTYEEDKPETACLNQMLKAARLLIREGVGVDILDYNSDPLLSAWATSNSHYLGELRDTRLTRQFRILNQAQNLPGIRSLVGDVADMDPALVGEPADITYFSTMLYQLSPEEVSRALETADAATAPDGLIVVQDFVEVTPTGEFEFYDDSWPKWSYNVWVKNKQQPEDGWQKYFNVDGGRVKSVVLENAAREAPKAAYYRLDA